ncbi:hypothetical protein LXA43DRAFT_575885 [Ganoderma leucocontextum]|nr:hypothetical protein LXA43DRAFT_575885 [Ganoderma leucocontextum]
MPRACERGWAERERELHKLPCITAASYFSGTNLGRRACAIRFLRFVRCMRILCRVTFVSCYARKESCSKRCVSRCGLGLEAEVFMVKAGYSGFVFSFLGKPARRLCRNAWSTDEIRGCRDAPAQIMRRWPAADLQQNVRQSRWDVRSPDRKGILCCRFRAAVLGLSPNPTCAATPAWAPREPPAVAMPFSVLKPAWLSPSCVAFVPPLTSCYVSRLRFRSSCLRPGTYTYV